MLKTLSACEVEEAVNAKTKLGIRSNHRTVEVVLDTIDHLPYINMLYGPYECGEELILVSYRNHGGSETLQLLVRDCEGDFLDSTAMGAEKYDVGLIFLGG